MESPIRRALARVPRRHRIGFAVPVVFALILVPALVLANHQFSDVPTGASYHDEVETLVGAGITSGCGTGIYCPGSAVSRGQMAQFMVRGLGVASAGAGELAAAEAEEFYVATVPIHTGGLPGGTGFVTVDADLSILDATEWCPCGIIFSVQDTETFETAPIMFMVVEGPTALGGSANAGSVSWVFEVPTGTDVEYGLFASVFLPEITGLDEGTDGEDLGPMLFGNVTAEYAPFGQTPDLGPIKTLDADLPAWVEPATLEVERRAQER
jgi:hypothetical protein